MEYIKDKKLRRAFRGEPKEDRIILRVGPNEKRQIKQAALSVQLGMSEYLLQLHRYAIGQR